MTLAIYFAQSAERDLLGIYDYVAEQDSTQKANHLFDQLQTRINVLSESPERGTYPKELLAIGMREYRQIYLKPYRVIYRIYSTQIIIYLIADGRRDMQTLLERRLLGGE